MTEVSMPRRSLASLKSASDGDSGLRPTAPRTVQNSVVLYHQLLSGSRLLQSLWFTWFFVYFMDCPVETYAIL